MTFYHKTLKKKLCIYALGDLHKEYSKDFFIILLLNMQVCLMIFLKDSFRLLIGSECFEDRFQYLGFTNYRSPYSSLAWSQTHEQSSCLCSMGNIITGLCQWA